jgi:hypothetical protein
MLVNWWNTVEWDVLFWFTCVTEWDDSVQCWCVARNRWTRAYSTVACWSNQAAIQFGNGDWGKLRCTIHAVYYQIVYLLAVRPSSHTVNQHGNSYVSHLFFSDSKATEILQAMVLQNTLNSKIYKQCQTMQSCHFYWPAQYEAQNTVAI